MDLSFLEKLKFILDVITNKQNQKSGEEIYQNYKSFLLEIQEIDGLSGIDEIDKKILKNLKVGGLTGAGNSNYEDFLFFKKVFPTDKLLINYWSFVRNRDAYIIEYIDLDAVKIITKTSGQIRSHCFYLILIFVMLLIASTLVWILIQQILVIKGELSLTFTIAAVIIGFLATFLLVTVFRLFFEHSAFSSLNTQIKSINNPISSS